MPSPATVVERGHRGGRVGNLHPTVTTGSDFYMTPLTDGRRTLLPFRMDGHENFVERVVTTGVPLA
jgi:hypothetical protein